ncbi:MAG: Transcriptional regulator, AcrR family [Ktedonobacterales bacterium]|jgi:AcrR family transcriptional regulator|nr:MAG: Transcriptional regulator, AcrR family [Ktedonobacterales bacterium]
MTVKKSASQTAEQPATAETLAQGRDAHRDETAPLVPVTARGEATRRRILDAAEDVFGEMGYYEASISEITRRAGVAQGTFYIYFHTKREIFAEMVGDLGHQLRAATRAAITGAPNRIEVERRGFAAFFAFVAAHRQLYRIVQESERVAPEAAQGYYDAISRGYEQGLREAMAAGEIAPANAEAIAYALMGIGHFLALRWLVWPQGAQADALPDEVLTSALEFITRGLGGPTGE